jgi:hypothetical protein
MPHPAHGAAARRDGKLLRIRRLTLWITGGAAAASLGLGTAFAHALPGHSYSTGSPASTGTAATGPGRPGHKSAVRPPASHGRLPGLHHRRAPGSSPRHQGLAAPARPPAPAPAKPPAPVVSSGGS